VKGRGRSVLAATALVLGGLAAGLGDPPVTVAPVQLALWLRDRRPDLEVIDLRDKEEFDRAHVAGARWLAVAEWPSYVEELALDPRRIVVLTTPRSEALRVASSSAQRERLYVLRGGVEAWQSEVLHPVLVAGASPAEVAEFAQVAALSRYFGGAPRVGERSLTPAWRRGC
jgi:rhodanese-related sulfurtransferase